jgi:ABC-2 type transport system ATP-binding protein
MGRAAVTVSLRQLTKRFPVRRGWRQLFRNRGPTYMEAVRDVSFEVGAGEFFGLLGPNGAGKTTLFKMLSTLIAPDHGTATIAGYDLRREAGRVRSVLTPVIADERSLNWRVSARENLRFYAHLYGLGGPALRKRVDELLRIVELADTREKMVGTFSSGMKQRLLLARALLARPRVMLLDEPTRSLDPISARRFRRFLRTEIGGVHGCTILLATHNAEEALELCDRLAVLDRGRLIAVGSPGELAQGLGEERYQVWTPTPEHESFAILSAQRVITDVVRTAKADGWYVVELNIAGGDEMAVEVVSALVRLGAQVARVEKARVALADLLEKLVGNGREDSGA